MDIIATDIFQKLFPPMMMTNYHFFPLRKINEKDTFPTNLPGKKDISQASQTYRFLVKICNETGQVNGICKKGILSHFCLILIVTETSQ